MWVLVALALLTGLSIAARLLTVPLARSAIGGERVGAWKEACAFAGVLPWIGFSAVLAGLIVIYVALADALSSELWVLLALGPFLQVLYDQAKAMKDRYWKRVSDSLKAAAPEDSDTRRVWNDEHQVLEKGDAEDRRDALWKILHPNEYEVIDMGRASSGGDDDDSPKA